MTFRSANIRDGLNRNFTALQENLWVKNSPA
jgi:hypothetical protein